MKKTSSGLSGSLFELIFALVIFALVAAICVKIFAYSSELSDQSAQLSQAIIWAETAAETFKAGGGDAKTMAVSLDGKIDKENNLQVEYPSSPGIAESKKLLLTGEFEERQGLVLCEITVVNKAGESIFSITASIAKEVAE